MDSNIWTQVYDPMGNVWLSAFVASIPILFFFIGLLVFKLKGHIASIITVAIAVTIALIVYKMPFVMVASSFLYGFLFGLWPIAWIIVTAVFLYKLSVKTGKFDIIRSSVATITDDQRLQVVLIGFCFGAFLEGAAGFGAPVAITAALLAGLGVNPLYAAGLCLIANTAPVAFGAIGVPITAVAALTKIPANDISAMVGRMLPPLSIFVPFFLVYLMDGIKGVKETFPAVAIASGTFVITQFVTSNYVGPELPDITAALVSLVATTLFLKTWKPKNSFKFTGDKVGTSTLSTKVYSVNEILVAWLPFIILTLVIVIWSLPSFKNLFKADALMGWSVLKFNFATLTNMVVQTPPVVLANKPLSVAYSLNIISATGTGILIAGIITAIVLNIKASTAISTFGETLKELRYPILTIGLVLSFAFISNYSGLSASLALALASTGKAFVFFSPIIGWLGVVITGSDTSSNLLFGTLQQISAQQIGVSDVLLVSANTVGGVVGKMISPQSIAVACAAVGLVGKESDLFRFTFKYALAFVLFISILTALIAFVFPFIIPVYK